MSKVQTETATMTGHDPYESHPSLEASLEDFEPPTDRPPHPRYPSYRSGFGQSETSEPSHSSSDNPFAPTIQKTNMHSSTSGWYRHHPYREEPRSRTSITPDPAMIPLPRGSMSPEKGWSREPESRSTPGRSPPPPPLPPLREMTESPVARSPEPPPGVDNYIRFSIRADMQQRTEPFDTVINYLRAIKNRVFRSTSSFFMSFGVLLFSLILIRALTRPPMRTPSPDLVKVAGLARNFEPLIYFSENGVEHVTNLQETGIAVWDLGESVRAANMTWSKPIVTQLEDLGDSLKALGGELTKFFASVDGDIDNILLVLDWAKRELNNLGESKPAGLISAAVSNVHSMILSTGFFSDSETGTPNSLGNVLANILGATDAQRTKAALQKTFVELLSTLEESINAEITHTTKLFSMFALLDTQFQNLQRTTVREIDTADQEESELLSSLWQRVMGANASKLRKFEKNKILLQSIRQRTLMNKSLLMEHDRKLKFLQHNLEELRRRLMKPVLHQTQGSSSGVDEQIRGLDDTYGHLKEVRTEQKNRVMDRLYGQGIKTMQIDDVTRTRALPAAQTTR